MREMARHTAGRIFLLVLLLSSAGMLFVPALCTTPVLYFGWMTMPFVAGVVYMLIWLAAYLVYFFGFWPFRK